MTQPVPNRRHRFLPRPHLPCSRPGQIPSSPIAVNGVSSRTTSAWLCARLADSARLNRAVSGVGTVGILLQQATEDAVSIGRLIGIDKNPAPLGKQGVGVNSG